MGATVSPRPTERNSVFHAVLGSQRSLKGKFHPVAQYFHMVVKPAAKNILTIRKAQHTVTRAIKSPRFGRGNGQVHISLDGLDGVLPVTRCSLRAIDTQFAHFRIRNQLKVVVYEQSSKSGERSSRDTPNPVSVRLADETTWEHRGVMDFVDNEVNAHSGTIRGRAVLDNKDLFLTPGTFGRLRLYGGPLDALLVPDAAIVSDQAQKVVLTVGPDNKVVGKPVKLGGMARGLRVIASGLAPTDRVVVGGLANPFGRAPARSSPPATARSIHPTASSPRRRSPLRARGFYAVCA